MDGTADIVKTAIEARRASPVARCHAMKSLACGFGLLLILVVLQDAFEVMLLPRRVQRRLRFMALYFRFTWRGLVAAVARRLPAGQRREELLSHFGALSMMGCSPAGRRR